MSRASVVFIYLFITASTAVRAPFRIIIKLILNKKIGLKDVSEIKISTTGAKEKKRETGYGEMVLRVYGGSVVVGSTCTK